MRLTEAQFAALKGGKKVPKASRGDQHCDLFAAQLKMYGIAHTREFRFAPPRKFRFDFVLHERQIAIEIDGGVHRIENRFRSDREKFNLATSMWWRVFRFSPDQVRDLTAIALIRRVMQD